MSPLFDRYLFVDWSAVNRPGPVRPKKHTIWVAMLERGEGPLAWYCRTREDAFTRVLNLLREAVAAQSRTLVGFDFPYGYPRGLGRALGLPDPQWSALWEELRSRITDDPTNRSNRFEVAAEFNARLSGGPGPFWGCFHPVPTLERTGARFPFTVHPDLALQRLRACEKRLPGTQEVWKLAGAGSAGSQALVGIPRVHALRWHPELAAVSRVWPFETGFDPLPERRPLVIHAEIWPRVAGAIAPGPGQVLDQAQVLALCRWAAELDRHGELEALFGRPEDLPEEQAASAVAEEGWILGAP